MFISIAYAAGEAGAAATATPADAFWSNMGLIAVMFLLFYFLMIRPQQKRLKEQRLMLDDLKKGDKVVTGGGLVGTVSKVISDTEVEVDLGGSKVTALRYTIQTRMSDDAVVTTSKAEVKPAEKTPAVAPKAKAAPAKRGRKPGSTNKKTAPAAAKPATKKAAAPKAKATPKKAATPKAKAAPKKTTAAKKKTA